MCVLQNGYTPLHLASINKHMKVVQNLIDRGADVYAKDSTRKTALDLCVGAGAAETTIAAFLRRCMEPKFKMYALCMGLHCRLGVDSPLNMLNMDVMQEIARHLNSISQKLW
jgi:hypothetical protein